MSNLLIAEDEIYIRFMLRSILPWAELGFDTILEADNGGTALEILRREKPALTLIDIRMPVMDGIEVAERAEEENLPCSFIIITGYADFSYARRAVRNRCIIDYLLKPINEEALRNAHKKFIKPSEPVTPSELELTELIEADRSEDWLSRAMQEIESNICAEISLSEIARRCDVSIGHLSNCVKRRYGVSYTEYIMTRRMKIAARLLTETRLPISRVAASVGYRDPMYFHKLFKKQFKLTPGEYRKRTQPY